MICANKFNCSPLIAALSGISHRNHRQSGLTNPNRPREALARRMETLRTHFGRLTTDHRRNHRFYCSRDVLANCPIWGSPDGRRVAARTISIPVAHKLLRLVVIASAIGRNRFTRATQFIPTAESRRNDSIMPDHLSPPRDNELSSRLLNWFPGIRDRSQVN